MKILFFLVDSFTEQVFAGNPAAVCIIEKNQVLSDAVKQRIAMELNQAETAFVQLQDENAIALQWFTPTVEIDLCGHATLAAAHILFSEANIPDNPIKPGSTVTFSTKSGLLPVTLQQSQLEMHFPSRLPQPFDGDEAEIALIQQYLGIEDFVALHVIPESDTQFYLVELSNEAVLRSLNPDFSIGAKLANKGNVIVSSESSDANIDISSRVFAPGVGIPEDPVTGAAHCSLAPYWCAKQGKSTLRAYQASKRGGYLQLSYDEKKASEGVIIKGNALTVIRGELLL